MRTPASSDWRTAGLTLVLIMAGCSKSSTNNNPSGGSISSGGSNSGSNTNGGSNSSSGSTSKTGGSTSNTSGSTSASGGSTGTSSGSTSASGGSTSTTGSTAASCTGADLQSDANNCGKCGTVCASKICNAGVCKKVKACATKVTVTDPTIADFETYDGTTALDKWGWAMNAPAGSANAVYAGVYEYNDGTGTPKLSLLGPGYSDSKYAANIQNAQDKGWGGSMGVWMGCVDASAYQGVSFWVKGTVPNGSGTLIVATEATSPPDKDDSAGGGTCTSGTCAGPSIDFPVTTSWTQVLVKWDGLKLGTANGTTVTTSAKEVIGLSWTAGAKYTSAGGDAGWLPSPGSYDLTIDNVQFMGATACDTGLKVCGTGCVDTSKSNDNCGTCGNGCKDSRTCSAGTCVCPSAYTDCNGQCVDTKIDAQNCGGCGKACTGECSGGSCSPSTCKANMTAQNKTSTAADSITLGRYWINNNQWGNSGATAGSQSIWSTCTSGNTIGWGTDWTGWAGGAGQVKSYASAVLGWQWGWKIANTGLPVQLSAGKTITCGWTYRVTPGQTIDVSYDMFAHTTASPGTNDDPTDEIMIWLYRSGGAAPIGGTTATIDLGGASWEVHTGNNGRWNVVSYVRTTNADTGATLTISDFIKDLTSKRNMSGS
ncbi:MAG TPA: hypothetical protein VF518_04710, partial [Polyangia bacterium]